jgi:Flp pilus assembly protein TadG
MFRSLKGKNRQGGVAAIEFAIVLPVCLFLFLSVVEFGRAIMQYNTLTRTVRDAARFASSAAFQGQTQIVKIDAQLISDVGNVAAYGVPVASTAPLLPGLAPANFIVADDGGGVITVTATYAYQPLLGAVLPQVSQSAPIASAFTMRAQATMRAL